MVWRGTNLNRCITARTLRRPQLRLCSRATDHTQRRQSSADRIGQCRTHTSQIFTPVPLPTRATIPKWHSFAGVIARFGHPMIENFKRWHINRKLPPQKK
ncbi:hypothetical protein RF11_16102 [Thelohanellus kitauei]|uniref:Uncharacterized protein n=1 Tax=Thelohanellus kitauei TaxID=669202 RepID=A0A0C2MEZ9_THEKT|nr:hypothetical protein RF11_16102 [Thelohanellus kitauei]